MSRSLLLFLTAWLTLLAPLRAGELPSPSAVHVESVTVELDPETRRPSGSRVGIGTRRAAALEAELARRLRRALEEGLAAAGITVAADPAAARLVLRVRALGVRLHPIADDLATPLASYGRSEAGARLTLEALGTDGRTLFTLSEDFAAPDPGELRPQSALQSRKVLEGFFARFARAAGRRLGGHG